MKRRKIAWYILIIILVFLAIKVFFKAIFYIIPAGWFLIKALFLFIFKTLFWFIILGLLLMLLFVAIRETGG